MEESSENAQEFIVDSANKTVPLSIENSESEEKNEDLKEMMSKREIASKKNKRASMMKIEDGELYKKNVRVM